MSYTLSKIDEATWDLQTDDALQDIISPAYLSADCGVNVGDVLKRGDDTFVMTANGLIGGYYGDVAVVD